MPDNAAPVTGFLNMTNTLYEAGLLAPLIPRNWQGGVEGSDWCWTINCDLDPMVAYMLNAGAWEDSDVDTDEAPHLLDRFFEPAWDYWMLAHAGHGANSYGLGIVAKFGSFFFSQQVGYGGVYMENPQFDVNRVHTAYNTHIAPLQGDVPQDDSAAPLALLFSDYRGYALLVSPILTLCHDADPQDNPLVPPGWGIIYDAMDRDGGDAIAKHFLVDEARNFDPRIAAAIDYLDAAVVRR